MKVYKDLACSDGQVFDVVNALVCAERILSDPDFSTDMLISKSLEVVRKALSCMADESVEVVLVLGEVTSCCWGFYPYNNYLATMPLRFRDSQEDDLWLNDLLGKPLKVCSHRLAFRTRLTVI